MKRYNKRKDSNSKYIKIRNDVVNGIRKSKGEFEANLAKNIQQFTLFICNKYICNPKSFLTYRFIEIFKTGY